MWIPVILCLFAAAANCGVYGWKTGYIYKYDYKLCFQFNKRGMVTERLVKGDMYIQPLSSDKLSLTFQNFLMRMREDTKEMAHCGPFPSDELNFVNMSFDGNPSEITLNNGILTSLKVNQNLGDGDRNGIMVVVDQLQLSLRGGNCEEPKSCPSSSEIKPNAVYQVTENTIGGKCETQYEVSLLPEGNLQRKPDENGPFFMVVKNTDYKKCQEPLKDPEAEKLDLFTHSNHIIVSGNKEEHTIQAINSTIRRAEFLGPTHLSKPTLLLVTNMTLISTDPTDGFPQNISNHQVFDSLYFKFSSS